MVVKVKNFLIVAVVVVLLGVFGYDFFVYIYECDKPMWREVHASLKYPIENSQNTKSELSTIFFKYIPIGSAEDTALKCLVKNDWYCTVGMNDARVNSKVFSCEKYFRDLTPLWFAGDLRVLYQPEFKNEKLTSLRKVEVFFPGL